MGLAAVFSPALPASAPRFKTRTSHEPDQLLGTATVSLAPLLQEPLLDGYAPVMAAVDPDNAMNPRSATAAEHGGLVKVGELRMVLSLAEKGPLPAWASKMGGYDRPARGVVVAAPTQPVPVTPAAHNKHQTMRASIERAAAIDKDSGASAAPTWSVGEALASQYTGCAHRGGDGRGRAARADGRGTRESIPGMAKSVGTADGRRLEDALQGKLVRPSRARRRSPPPRGASVDGTHAPEGDGAHGRPRGRVPFTGGARRELGSHRRRAGHRGAGEARTPPRWRRSPRVPALIAAEEP